VTALLEYLSVLLEYINLFSQHLYEIASYKSFFVASSNLSFNFLHTLFPPIIAVTSDYSKIMPVAIYYSKIILTKLLTYYFQNDASITGASLKFSEY